MLLAVDVGNTNVVFALCEGEAIRAQWRIRTEHQRSADEYAMWLFALMARAGFNEKQITAVMVASVVPDVNFELKSFARHYLRLDPLMVAAGQIDVGMPILIDNPKELGADRLINAYAAWSVHKQALIVIDFGTATTFDVVSGAGEYVGGVIAPGINLSLEALHRAAAKLPGVAIAHPQTVVGTTTIGAMQSGIFYGYAGLIEGIVSRIKAERGEAMKVIATGGLAPLYAEGTTVIDLVDTDLTICGLIRIYAGHSMLSSGRKEGSV